MLALATDFWDILKKLPENVENANIIGRAKERLQLLQFIYIDVWHGCDSPSLRCLMICLE